VAVGPVFLSCRGAKYLTQVRCGEGGAGRTGGMSGVSLGFAPEPVSIRVGQILPVRRMPDAVGTSRKFKQIRSSIATLRLIEPLTVMPVIRKTGQHMLLDGNIRLIKIRASASTGAILWRVHDRHKIA
jgi:hypothetical protein